MSGSDPAKVLACMFALAAFAVAIIAGLSAGNGAARVLGCALVAMFICHLLGLAIGGIGQRIVTEHLASVKSEADASIPGAATSPRTS